MLVWVLAVLGLFLQSAGLLGLICVPPRADVHEWLIPGLCAVLGGTLFVFALACHAKTKRRSPAWGLLGIFWVFGMVVPLILLEDRTPKAIAKQEANIEEQSKSQSKQPDAKSPSKIIRIGCRVLAVLFGVGGLGLLPGIQAAHNSLEVVKIISYACLDLAIAVALWRGSRSRVLAVVLGVVVLGLIPGILAAQNGLELVQQMGFLCLFLTMAAVLWCGIH